MPSGFGRSIPVSWALTDPGDALWRLATRFNTADKQTMTSVDTITRKSPNIATIISTW